ncbi:hypothetical protein BH10PSE14_BH10PSE14_20850 [soil metagenome]
MKLELDQPDEEPLFLIDVQAVPFENGYVIRHGLTRLFLEAPGLETVFEVLVDLTRSQQGARSSFLMSAVGADDRPVMEGLIAALRQRRLLVPVGEIADPAAEDLHERVFYWSYGTSGAAVRERLGQRRMAVIGYNNVGTALATTLAEIGFGSVTLVDHPMLRNLSLEPGTFADPMAHEDWVEADDLPDCIILTSDFGGPDIAREWNAFCVANNVHFYPAFVTDHVGLIGPMVLPKQSACYECFALRERAASAEVALRRATDGLAYFSQPSFGFVKPMAQAVAALAATELLKFYSQALPGGNIGRMIEYDMLVPALDTHRVLKLPRCPVCGPVVDEPTFTSETRVFMPGNE